MGERVSAGDCTIQVLLTRFCRHVFSLLASAFLLYPCYPLSSWICIRYQDRQEGKTDKQQIIN